MTKKLKSLNVNKSPGPAGLYPRFLFETSEAIAYPLELLFDATMKSEKNPAKWEIAEVNLLFKKGKRYEAENYRPVSLTSIVCKVFESFLNDALYQVGPNKRSHFQTYRSCFVFNRFHPNFTGVF